MSRLLRLAVLLPFLMAPFAAAAEEAEKPAEKPKETELRKASSAGPARFVHRIHLKDADGAPLGPESTVPYSPKSTCSSSTCHSYDTIVQGTHTQMFPASTHDAKTPQSHKWTVFDAATFVTAPLDRGFLASKAVPFDSKLHENMFDIVRDFGAWHPGGGRFELDSAGKRYDVPKVEPAEGEAPETADYTKAKWDESGVMEADCLACHLQTPYDHVERADQISRRNYRYAPTVGAGFGVVEGTGAARKVHYAKSFFNAEGKVNLPIGRPRDANCLYCHRRPALGETTWADCLEADVHSQSGLACVDCHSAGTNHVIFGDPAAKATADRDTLSCQGCHESGRLGSPIPKHWGLPRLHLEEIACQACHAGPRPRVTPLALEVPTDPLWGLPLGSTKPSGPTVFAPVFACDAHGKIHLVSRMLPAWFGNKLEDGTIVPLTPAKLKSRLRKAISAKLITDNDGDGEPEINTEAEIAAALKALVRKGVVPVYFASGHRYELELKEGEDEENAKLISAKDPLADPIDRPLAHNVRPAWQAIGAKGCVECHSTDSPFFRSLALTQAMGADGKPQGTALFARLGKSESDVRMAAFREGYVRFYGEVFVGLFVGLLVFHYVLFGPRRYRRRAPDELVPRFNVVERLAHLALFASFGGAMATGMLNSVGIDFLFGVDIEMIHALASLGLLGSAALFFLLFVRHMFSARFNRDQKAYFWFILIGVVCLTVCHLSMRYEVGGEGWRTLAFTAYILCAQAMIICVMAHIYLVTFGNPGTLGGMFHGKVEREWLAHHHPDWKAEPAEKE